MVAYFQADNALAHARYEESLQLFRELADQEQIATLLDRLVSLARAQGDCGQDCRVPRRGARALSRCGAHPWHVRSTDRPWVYACSTCSEYRCARALFEEGLALAVHSEPSAASPAPSGAWEKPPCWRATTRRPRSTTGRLWHSVRTLGIKMDIAVNLGTLGLVALCQGEAVQAAAYFMESMVINRELGRKRGLVYNLAGCASVACLQGQPSRAARLFGAAAALSERFGHALELTNRTLYERDVAATRTTLGAAAFDAAYAAGHALPLDQALAEALDVAHAAQSALPTQPVPVKPTYPADLTEREVEVLRWSRTG